MSVKQLDLLRDVRFRYPDGIIWGRGDFVTLFELGANFRSPDLIARLKELWEPGEGDRLYVIDLAGIDVLAPSAAGVLVEVASHVATAWKNPVLFTDVRREVEKALDREARLSDFANVLWVADERGRAKLVGRVPGKFAELLRLLEENGPSAAGQLAALLERGAPSKKAVGNVSVYLQKLFAAGLVGREKVTALDRHDAERGWTYIYSTAPAILAAAPPELVARKPD